MQIQNSLPHPTDFDHSRASLPTPKAVVGSKAMEAAPGAEPLTGSATETTAPGATQGPEDVAVPAPAAGIPEPVPAPWHPSAQPADLSTAPVGLDGLAYTSNPAAPLVPRNAETPDYILGGIGTPPEVGQLAEGGGANFLNPNWQAMVRDHAARNGGLGNETDGFLAFSQNGFVRFYNPNLSPEQNRRLAAISLQTGWPLEKMPSRANEGGENIDRWVNTFVERFDRGFAEFQQDPMKNQLEVKDGHKRFVLAFNEQANGFVSYNYKKHGGFRGFVEKNFKIIAPILDGIALVGGPIVGGIAMAVRAGVNYAVTGSLKVRDLVMAGIRAFLPAAPTVNQALGAGAGLAAADLVDNGGKLTAGVLLDGISPYLDVKGYAQLKEAAGVLAGVIDTGKLDPSKLLGLVKNQFGDELAGLFKESPLGFLGEVAKGMDGGKVSPDQAESFFGQILDTIGKDKQLRAVLQSGLRAAFDAVRGKKVGAADILKSLTAYIGELVGIKDAEARLMGQKNPKAA